MNAFKWTHNKIIKIILCGILVLFFSNLLHSQTDLPKIIWPSPETSSLFRYQDYPMDYSTGLPQITIPLYEIKTDKLSLPISISYHASGLKIDEPNGPISVGWSLNAGGVINRTVHGSVDFGNVKNQTQNFPFPFELDGLNNVDDLSYFQRITHLADCNLYTSDWYDSEYDIFSYTFGGFSGKLVFKDENNVKTPVWIPYKPFLINYSATPTGLDSIKITDNKGILYEFEPGESYSPDVFVSTSAWMLKKIISADKSDSIIINYLKFRATRVTITEAGVLDDAWTMQGESAPGTIMTFPTTTNTETYGISRISEIIFKQGKIKFVIEPNTGIIDSIQLFNSDNILMKTIGFRRSSCYSAPEADIYASKLDSIVFVNNYSINAPKVYSFEYYPVITSSPPNYINPRFRDWWGYYNNSGEDMMPYWTNVPYITSLGIEETISVGNVNCDREPHLEPLKSGVLKKIIYPTGGNTEFIYELNKCKLGDVGSERTGPGLRVSQIKTSDGFTNMIKTYKYGKNESGYGNIDMLPDYKNMTSEILVEYLEGTSFNPQRIGTYRERIFHSDFVPELQEIASRPVIYPEVTEYFGTNTTPNNGKIKYYYNFSSWSTSLFQSTLQSASIPPQDVTNYDYVNSPSLFLKQEFRYAPGATDGYEKIRSTGYRYSYVYNDPVNGLKVKRNISVPQTGIGEVILPGTTTSVSVCPEKYSVYGDGLSTIYAYSQYNITTGVVNLIEQIDSLFDGSIPLIQKVSYQYNVKNLMSRQITNSSKRNTLITEIKYPVDYSGNTTLDQMTGLNMLDYPVERIDSMNNGTTSIPIRSTRSNYFNFGTTPARISIQSVDIKNGHNAYESRLNFIKYNDNTNILEQQKTNDAKQSYIWDYKEEYPIAQVVGSAVADIAYTSFEADGKGNWTYSGTPTADITAPTGKRVFTIADTANNITKTGLNTSKTYIVSYWKKSGTVAVNSTTPVSGSTVDGWTYYEHKVINPSGGTITVSGTNGVIDELRLYPDGAQMTTYTYEPLVGMKSQCDANNRITYYEYDGFGRLMIVRDQDKKVLKKICYNYAGQPEGCLMYGNQSRSQVFRKNDCTGCQIGEEVIYTVPADTYYATSQEEANTLALDDIDANGQDYANANGTSCTAPVMTNINGYNGISGKRFTLLLHNNCTGTNYYIYLDPGATGVDLNPQIPTGNYNVTITPDGGSGPYSYSFASFYQYASTASFLGIDITTTKRYLAIQP